MFFFFCGEADNTLFKFSQNSFSNLPPLNRLCAPRCVCVCGGGGGGAVCVWGEGGRVVFAVNRTSCKHRLVRIYMTERSVFPCGVIVNLYIAAMLL